MRDLIGMVLHFGQGHAGKVRHTLRRRRSDYGAIHERREWPRFRWPEPAITVLLAAVRHRQGFLIGRMEVLGSDLQVEGVLVTLNEDLIKSSEIEGKMLNREQVRLSFARRLKALKGLRHTNSFAGNGSKSHQDSRKNRSIKPRDQAPLPDATGLLLGVMLFGSEGYCQNHRHCDVIELDVAARQATRLLHDAASSEAPDS